MENSFFYIITEGRFDAMILEKIIPHELMRNSKLISSMGFSSALSKAKSLTLRVKNKIILVLDSDSISETETQYKKEDIEFVFRGLGKQDQVVVFLFRPEIEVIFFESEELYTRLVERRLLNDIKTTSIRNKIKDKFMLIDQLNERDIELIQIETSMKILIDQIKNCQIK